MGESSAKNLRGESMADVIFNGSVNRQPLGQASIELVFDNTEGRVGGEFASYSGNFHQVARSPATGSPSISSTARKCRRRDITDIFLGTGLGPRSYAIIEQGMISRLIESKPEELRVFIEEAAGISKYKERRRETESRMRRTLENLERLTDLRDELGRQLQHLERQSQAAEKYRTLKREERELRQRLLAARIRELRARQEVAAHEVREEEVRLEAVYAEQQAIDTALEQHRVNYSERNDALVEVQGRFYAIGAEVSRIEQEIRYQGERAEQLSNDLHSTRAGLEQAQRHVTDDGERLTGWERELAELTPALEANKVASAAASAALEEAESACSPGSRTGTSSTRRRRCPVSRLRCSSPYSASGTLAGPLAATQDQLVQERDAQGDDAAVQTLEELRRTLAEAESGATAATEQVETIEGRLTALRQERRSAQESLNEERSRLQVKRGRQASLEALQQAAKETRRSGKVGQGCASAALRITRACSMSCRSSRAGSVRLKWYWAMHCRPSVSMTCGIWIRPWITSRVT